MLPKQERLNAREVREVLKHGRSVRGEWLSVKFIKTDTALRAAAVVQKSLARNATTRNRLRRAVYQALGISSHSCAHTRAKSVFFVNKIPKELHELLPTFTSDTETLLKKISHTYV